MIITHSMKLQENSMSARSKGLSNITAALIDEATELPSEEEYVKLIDSFRAKGVDRKIFLLFNPTSKNHWIFKRFYLPNGQPNPKWAVDHGFIHTTYHDNWDNLDPKKIQEWERAAIDDPEYYEHHILGHWRDVGAGRIFSNWNFSYEPDPECEEIIGLDWGFSQDPTAVIRVLKRGKRVWIEELLYESGLVISEVADILSSKGISKSATIYCDASEPRSIEELKRQGFRNVRPAIKGADSIRAGINKIKEFEVYVNPNSKNLISEYEAYSYREGTDKPIDNYNHLMDAFRYALSTHRSGPVVSLPSPKITWKTYTR
jgi:phage terminase large subunit